MLRSGSASNRRRTDTKPRPGTRPFERIAECSYTCTRCRAAVRRDDMQVTRIGDFEVQRITEFEGPFIAPEVFFPDFDPEVLRSNPDMAGPRLIDAATGKLIFSFHSFVVKT